MKVLLLSSNYPPDLGPGSLRAHSIASALAERNGVELTVITTSPNRYKSISVPAASEEVNNGIKIKRIAIPKHKNGLLDQAISFLIFALGVRRAIKASEYDIVVSTSSRLMTASLSAWVSNKIEARLHLDIRDLFVDTMDDVFKDHPVRFLIPIFRYLERWTFRKAATVSLVSQGFVDYVKDIVPDVPVDIFTNGIDEQFVSTNHCPSIKRDPPTVLYAGNIGEGQGLENILPQSANRFGSRIRFLVIGDGGRRRVLESAISNCPNVVLMEPIGREALIDQYREADVLFLHLNDYQAFLKVLPSKIFEYGATGKPILAGVTGYAADFLNSHVTGAEVFNPCDVNGMVDSLQRLLAGPRSFDRSGFCEDFNRKKIVDRLALFVLAGPEI